MSAKLTIEIDLNKLADPEINAAALNLLSLIIAKDGAENPELESIKALAQGVPANRRKRKSSRRPVLTGTPEERWHLFYADLPDRSKIFADLLLLRAPEPVTQAEVMDALEMESPKAMGGLLGTLTRWSSAVEVTLPWEPANIGNKRAWRWIGFMDEPADGPSTK